MSEIVSKPALSHAQLDELIKNRWSPRIYDTSHELTRTELESLGEAFRWAPSSMNAQPWKLVFVTRGSDLHQRISKEALGGFNAAWAPHAAAMAIVLGAKTKPTGEELNKVGTAYDLGLASMKLIIQAEAMGLKAHVMGGINHELIAEILGAKDHFVMVAIAVGKQGSLHGQSEAIVARETSPRERKTDTYLIDQAL